MNFQNLFLALVAAAMASVATQALAQDQTPADKPYLACGNALIALQAAQDAVDNYPGRDDRPGTPPWWLVQSNLQQAQLTAEHACKNMCTVPTPPTR